jgi:hypothetical protein
MPDSVNAESRRHLRAACAAVVASRSLSTADSRNRSTLGAGGIAEDVVVGLELVKAESVGDHRRGVELVTGDQFDQCRLRIRVDKPGRDGQVLDPDVLQVQSRRRSVPDDVGDVTAGADQPYRLLEGLRDPDGLLCHIGTQTAGEFSDYRQRVVVAAVEDHVGAELACRLQPGISQVDRDDVTRAGSRAS